MQKLIILVGAALCTLSASAQLIDFSPALKPNEELTYYVFKEKINASKLGKDQKQKKTKDTILLHLKFKEITEKGSKISLSYDYSKSSITKKGSPDFNYILARTQEGNINLELDPAGSITQITNRDEIRKRYKAILEELKKTAKEEDQPVYEDLADEMDDNAQLDYLMLEDMEILFAIWNSQFEVNNQYTIEGEIESPYSVRTIPAIGIISVTLPAKQGSLVSVDIKYLPDQEKAVKEMENIRKVLKNTLIIPDGATQEDIFDINEQFSFMFDNKTKRFTFASKLRVHTEASKDKLTLTTLTLAK